MIEAVMLAALGFLSASLIALMVAPTFWSRALRLASERMRNSLPVSEAEFRADKDLMRADFAVRVHQLEKDIERYKLNGHRQFIEINRRDAQIVKLTEDQQKLAADLAENRNARSVLEQTVNDRLPRLEHRLVEARQLIGARDQEIATLSVVGNRQLEALEEARAIGLQQVAEIDRLKSALAAFQSRDRRRFSDAGGEQEYALRGELDRVRALARQQTSHIERLAGELAVAKAAAPSAAVGGSPSLAQRAGADVDELSILRARLREQAAEIERMKIAGGSAGAGMAALALPAGSDAGADAGERIQTLEATIKRLEQTIAELSADQQASVAGYKQNGAVADVAKAAAGALRDRFRGGAKGDDASIARLRAELAAANDRAARQAAYFMDEMRRLGSGRGRVPEAPAKSPLLRQGRRPAGRGDGAAAAAASSASELTIAGVAGATAAMEASGADGHDIIAADAAAAVAAMLPEVPAPASPPSDYPTNVLPLERNGEAPMAASNTAAAVSGGGEAADILVLPGDRQRPPSAIELSVAAANEAADAELEDLSRRKRLLDRLKSYDDR